MYEAILRRELISDKRICRLLGVVTFIILMILGAFVRIPLPFTPVPFTLQTFFVLLSGAMLGVNLGALTQLGYIALGASGLSVFTNAGSGLGYLLGPTGGYIFGFLLASLFIGRTIKIAGKSLLYVFILMCVADSIILISGAMWLKVLLGYDTVKIFAVGFLPFVAGDILKATAAALIYLKIKPRIRQIF